MADCGLGFSTGRDDDPALKRHRRVQSSFFIFILLFGVIDLHCHLLHCCVVFITCGVYLCAVSQEQLHTFHLSNSGGRHQNRASTHITLADLRPTADQERGASREAEGCCDEERRSLRVREIVDCEAVVLHEQLDEREGKVLDRAEQQLELLRRSQPEWFSASVLEQLLRVSTTQLATTFDIIACCQASRVAPIGIYGL